MTIVHLGFFFFLHLKRSVISVRCSRSINRIAEQIYQIDLSSSEKNGKKSAAKTTWHYSWKEGKTAETRNGCGREEVEGGGGGREGEVKRIVEDKLFYGFWMDKKCFVKFKMIMRTIYLYAVNFFLNFFPYFGHNYLFSFSQPHSNFLKK